MALALASWEREEYGDASLAIIAAAKINPPLGLRNRAAEMLSDLSVLKQEHLAFKKAEDILATTPEDPAANLAKGRYLYLSGRNLEAGFASLAKGSDAALREVGIKEQAKPSTPEESAKLAENWYALTKAPKVMERKRHLERALYWMDLAVKASEGVSKVKLSQRQAAMEQLDPQLRGTLTEGLVGWWRFDDGFGDQVLDSSRLKNHGKKGTGVLWATGKTIGSLKFTSSDNTFSAPHAPYKSVVDTFTMSVWVKPGPGPEAYAIYPWQGQATWGGPNDVGAGLVVRPTGAHVVEHGPAYVQSDAIAEVAVKDWTHFAIVYEKKAPRLYVSGKLAKTGVARDRTVHPSAMSGPAGPYVPQPFVGEIDDLRIYDRVLTDTEIRTLSAMK